MHATVLQHRFRNVAPITDAPAVQWHVLLVRPRYEKILHRRLTEMGINSILPLVSRTTKYAGLMCKVEVPLFPGYVFVEADSDTIKSLVKLGDVIRVLTIDHDE